MFKAFVDGRFTGVDDEDVAPRPDRLGAASPGRWCSPAGLGKVSSIPSDVSAPSYASHMTPKLADYTEALDE